jgi:hypothetical protein
LSVQENRIPQTRSSDKITLKVRAIEQRTPISHRRRPSASEELRPNGHHNEKQKTRTMKSNRAG